MFLNLILFICAYEGGMSIARQARRKERFAQAQQAAQTAGRPLVVVGCPHMGFHSRIAPVYDHGDATFDLHPCGHPLCHCADLTQPRALPYDDDSAVVFESCVLAYIPAEHRRQAAAELLRVAGSPANVFSVPVGPSTSRLLPNAGSLNPAPACTIRSLS